MQLINALFCSWNKHFRKLRKTLYIYHLIKDIQAQAVNKRNIKELYLNQNIKNQFLKQNWTGKCMYNAQTCSN